MFTKSIKHRFTLPVCKNLVCFVRVFLDNNFVFKKGLWKFLNHNSTSHHVIFVFTQTTPSIWTHHLSQFLPSRIDNCVRKLLFDSIIRNKRCSLDHSHTQILDHKKLFWSQLLEIREKHTFNRELSGTNEKILLITHSLLVA